MINLEHNKTLNLSAAVFAWIEQLKIKIPCKYRLQKLIWKAVESGSRIFHLTKNSFEQLVESTNRRTQKEFLLEMQATGIMTVLREDHFQIHFELAPELFVGESMTKTLDLQYENPVAYSLQLDSTMSSRKTTTLEKYNEQISELLSEITAKDVLEKMGENPGLRTSYEDRIKTLKINIRNFERRHETKLDKEILNINSIERMISSVKIFNPTSQTYESQKAANKIKATPKDLVSYFYKKLSAKLGSPIFTTTWPSEIKSAKDVLKQMPDKDFSFIQKYIDWVIETQPGTKKMYNARYYVSQYLQSEDDEKEWKNIWENYISRSPNAKGFIDPKNEEELECLFVSMYEQAFKEKYKPTNLYKKDISKLKNLVIYLGNSFQQSVDMIVWCLKKVFPSQNEKPTSPGDLYRFITEFKDFSAKTTVINNNDPKNRLVNRMQDIIKRAAKRSLAFNLIEAEKQIIIEGLKQVSLEELDDQTRHLIATHKVLE